MSENHSTTHNPQTSSNSPATEEAAQDITAAPPHEPVSSAQFDLVALQAQNKELADQFLRAKAETNNARKRAEEEILKARKFAIENFAESLLPVADSLEAGLSIKDGTLDQIREGAQATLRQLQTALERNKVFAIQPTPGSKFDPHQHQAISVVPSNIEAGAIVSVLQKGYVIADRVLRPALVTVSGAGEQAATK